MSNAKNGIIKNKLKWEAHIGQNRNWWQYYNDYKKVVDYLIESIDKDNFLIDEVALPLLFMIRHSLELGLKANILAFEKVNVDVERISLKSKKGHSLEALYRKFIEHIEAVRSKVVENEVIKQIDRHILKFDILIKKLHTLDKGSVCIRYPVDTDGKNNFDMSVMENIADIIEMYNDIQLFLSFSVEVLIPEEF